MKKLFIKIKAKRYDKAIERAESLVDFCSDSELKTLEYVFPELKESEEERVRKSITEFFKNFSKNGTYRTIPDVAKWIAWLEKQGEHNKWKPSKDEMNALYGLSYITNKMDDKKDESITKLYQDLKREFFNGASYENMFPSSPVDSDINIEKQDKQQDVNIQINPSEYINDMGGNGCYLKNTVQKPADKVEPKFKVGDWILIDNPCQIESIDNNGNYIVRYCDAEETHLLSRNFCDSHFHLWSLNQDAKDGDVLYMDNGLSTCTFIYKSINNVIIQKYASYNKFGFEGTTYLVLNDGYVCPATKGQRDLLFQKMHETGYEWDAEKKELKKIEHTPKHKVGDTIYYNSFGDVKSMIVANVTTDNTDNPMYEDENGNIVFEEDLIEYNTAWSEESSAFKDKLLELFQRFRWYCKDKNPTNGDIIDYVNAHTQELIDTVQNKSWSEDDEEMLRRCISATFDHGYLKECNWLKCIKNRVQPKQEWSEEDKNAIQVLKDIVKHSNEINENIYTKPLKEKLYNWLKSLKDRYAWKPSDEQMKALWEAYKGGEKQAALAALYNDLKKLREE